MVSKERVACPAHDEEDPNEKLDTVDVEEAEDAIDEEVDELEEELQDALEDEDEDEDEDEEDSEAQDASGEERFENPGADESSCMGSVPPDRCFDISPEEFCGDPYEQEGHIESRQELGRKGEEAAVRYLKSRGYTILKRNWFCRFGEADIIARDPEGTLCFIEVKTRQSVEAGLPEEAVTRSKQSRYERIALCYMMVTDDWDDNDSVRFDAIAICVTAPHHAMLRHHRGCFNECL